MKGFFKWQKLVNGVSFQLHLTLIFVSPDQNNFVLLYYTKDENALEKSFSISMGYLMKSPEVLHYHKQCVHLEFKDIFYSIFSSKFVLFIDALNFTGKCLCAGLRPWLLSVCWACLSEVHQSYSQSAAGEGKSYSKCMNSILWFSYLVDDYW